VTSSVDPPLPADVDPALWYDSESCGRHYLLVGNPHTSRGQMNAYCAKEDVYLRVALGEIELCSEQALYFIRGFLSGNEPPPPLGDADEPMLADDPRYLAWRAAVDRFHEFGYWADPVDAAPDVPDGEDDPLDTDDSADLPKVV
jgi:hypothetical protein